MSKIARKPVPLPQGAQVQIKPGLFEVKGPKGTLSMPVPKEVEIVQEKNEISVRWKGSKESVTPAWGTTWSLANNLLKGATTGFTRSLELEGVGFRAEMKGKTTLMLNIGFTHSVEIPLPAGVTCTVEKNQTLISLNGPDKAVLGQLAAKIRGVRPPEPFKGKGIRYSGEVIRRKEGKAKK